MGRLRLLRALWGTALVVVLGAAFWPGIPVVAALSAPSVTVPSVTVPPVTVPSVTVPSVTAPSTTTPSVTTPPVTTPSVTTPPVTAPSVTVSPPSVPSAGTPAVTTPSVVAPAGSVPSVRAPSVSAPEISTPAASTPSASAPSSRSPGGLVGSGPPGPTAGGLPGASPNGGRSALTSRATRRALAHGTLSQARLERTIARLQTCFGQLPDRQRRVLSLRAGLGPREPLSRSQVAHRLDLGLGQAGSIERRGLRRLGMLDGAGACSAAGAAQLGLPGGAWPGAPAPLAGSGLGADPTADWSSSRSDVRGVRESGGGDGGGLALPPPIGDGADWTLLILLGLAAMLALLLRHEVRRR